MSSPEGLLHAHSPEKKARQTKPRREKGKEISRREEGRKGEKECVYVCECLSIVCFFPQKRRRKEHRCNWCCRRVEGGVFFPFSSCGVVATAAISITAITTSIQMKGTSRHMGQVREGLSACTQKGVTCVLLSSCLFFGRPCGGKGRVVMWKEGEGWSNGLVFASSPD